MPTYTKKHLKKMIQDHKTWLHNRRAGKRLDISFYNLQDVDLSSSNLKFACFQHADLYNVDFTNANLCHANFEGAYISQCNFTNTDLKRSTFSVSNIEESNFRGAALGMTSFVEAILFKVDLRRARYSVMSLLQSHWGLLPDNLTLELMRHDAEFIGVEAIRKWANQPASPCPYRDKGRDFFFFPDKRIWKPGKPKLRGIELLRELAKEKKIRL